ncbi:hypothetical protein THAOC_04449 [Thalassiosira oceanica]|uniref:Uncharacterized protein n=1 Tax=Thalassiosira oceanica TaxID=159749 RepID=K0T558_THAOC|nr:hypothetical protein THAOC_04449 [Thalassiosira oceanica]|eukprot:EJK73908.1 hypothetical protein THAOC_04449 [Thalassiosira oceanica]
MRGSLSTTLRLRGSTPPEEDVSGVPRARCLLSTALLEEVDGGECPSSVAVDLFVFSARPLRVSSAYRVKFQK